MAYNPNEHDLVMRERRADALHEAEHWRLLKAVRRQPNHISWLSRLSARNIRRLHIPREAEATQIDQARRPSVSGSEV